MKSVKPVTWYVRTRIELEPEMPGCGHAVHDIQRDDGNVVPTNLATFTSYVDASLAATAPEMLLALKSCLQFMEAVQRSLRAKEGRIGGSDGPLIAAVRGTIRRAEGCESPTLPPEGAA